MSLSVHSSVSQNPAGATHRLGVGTGKETQGSDSDIDGWRGNIPAYHLDSPGLQRARVTTGMAGLVPSPPLNLICQAMVLVLGREMQGQVLGHLRAKAWAV